MWQKFKWDMFVTSFIPLWLSIVVLDAWNIVSLALEKWDDKSKMLENLNLDEQQRNEFLNLAAEGRGEVPADIAKLIADHPAKLAIIRETLTSLLAAQG